jgi:hypothetical protein
MCVCTYTHTHTHTHTHTITHQQQQHCGQQGGQALVVPSHLSAGTFSKVLSVVTLYIVLKIYITYISTFIHDIYP